MHKTEGANSLNGYFTDGPPGTCVEENWLNAVQDEICNVIEAAMDDYGNDLVLKKAATDTRNQLLSAMRYFQIQVRVMTTAERDAMTARVGMIIYNSTTGKFQGYDGAWTDFGAMV